MVCVPENVSEVRVFTREGSEFYYAYCIRMFVCVSVRYVRMLICVPIVAILYVWAEE